VEVILITDVGNQIINGKRNGTKDKQRNKKGGKYRRNSKNKEK
jgi:hypothetical protein